MLFRGVRERDNNTDEKKELGNVPIGVEREIHREVDIDKDGNIEREKEEIIDREIPIDDGEERRIGGGMMRFKNREMFREKNQREFVRERPPRGESEDNNDDDERDSDKEEEIQNNNRNERSRRNNGRERYKKGESDDEESDE
jgi:hypothetical protein